MALIPPLLSYSRILAFSFIFKQKRQIHLNEPSIFCKKYNLDYSNYPKLNENDLEEQFILGSGPGGQSVNKTVNCVLLKHKPTGIVVKCHQSRLQQNNRKIARELLLQKLDNALNGDNSITNQKKRIDEQLRKAMESKKQKLRKLKEEWKKREGLIPEK